MSFQSFIAGPRSFFSRWSRVKSDLTLAMITSIGYDAEDDDEDDDDDVVAGDDVVDDEVLPDDDDASDVESLASVGERT